MPRVQNFHENLERDLARLTAEIKEQKKPISESERESAHDIVKRSLHVFTDSASVPATVSQEETKEGGAQNEFLPDYLGGSGIEPRVKVEIERLVDMVFHKDIQTAVKESRKHPPFVQDAFHDALVDKLLPELKKRGIVS